MHPLWRAAVGDAPFTLSQLLAPEVRQYRRVEARVQAAWRVQDDQRRRVAAGNLARDITALAAALRDAEAGVAVRYVLDGVVAGERWADEHPDLADATLAWWAQARSGGGGAPPAALVAQREAIRLSDPRLRRAAAALAAGHLVADYTLEPTSPIDGQQMVADALAHHDSRREQAVTAELHALPLHRRLRVARCDLEAAYDARHLYVCRRCALPHNVQRDPHEQGPLAMTCRCCGGSLVPAAEAPDLPPPLEDSLARVADRSEQLGSRPRPTRDRTVDRSPPFDGRLPGGTTTAPRCPSRSGDYPAIREVERAGTRPLPRPRGTHRTGSPAIREVRPAGRRPVPPMREPLAPVSITAREVTASGASGGSIRRGAAHRESITTREADAGAEAAVPSPEALRPYARALVVLAIEVRAEGLALPGERRSHGPIGRGGGRCAA